MTDPAVPITYVVVVMPVTVPSERTSPAAPLAERRASQRARLFDAATIVFTEVGYPATSVDAIARQAGMSKATFYELFPGGKEECLFELFDESARILLTEMATASALATAPDYHEHVRAGVRAFLETLASNYDKALVLLVEMQRAGNEAAGRRDNMLDLFAEAIFRDNAAHAPRFGAPVFNDRQDAFACVAAGVEMVSRKLRTGERDSVLELGPLITRMLLALLHMS